MQSLSSFIFIEDNDEMKKRMYSTIVVVGGGVAKFHGGRKLD